MTISLKINDIHYYNKNRLEDVLYPENILSRICA